MNNIPKGKNAESDASVHKYTVNNNICCCVLKNLRKKLQFGEDKFMNNFPTIFVESKGK